MDSGLADDFKASSEFVPVFRRIRRRSAVEQVVDEILGRIQDGRLHDGERLLPQRQLSDQLGVSRNILREALQVLVSIGVVEVVPGRGTYVSKERTDLQMTTMWLPWLSRNREDVLALLDVREALEVKAAILASRHRTEADLGALRRNIKQFEEAIASGDKRELDRKDTGFHELVAKASGNKFLISLSTSMARALVNDRLAIYSIPGRAARSALEHARVIEAVEAGDAALAAERMRQHVNQVKQAVEDYAE